MTQTLPGPERERSDSTALVSPLSVTRHPPRAGSGLRRAFTESGDRTRGHQLWLRPRLRRCWHQSWSHLSSRVGPPPTSGHLQLSSAWCADSRIARATISHNTYQKQFESKINLSNQDKIEGRTIEKTVKH